MSYVAISSQVMEKLVGEARAHPDAQIVGVLLGGQSGSTIMVEDATTGPAESDSTHVTLTGDSIARIADDIISKRIRGSIVGWYHSHVRGGVFMSETDVETQLKLQQFSPMVTAMVIDANTGKSGFFRADLKTKGAVPIPPGNVKTTEEIAAFPRPAEAAQPMYPQAPPPAPPGPSVSTRTILAAVVLITLAATAGIIALAYYRAPGAGGGTGNLLVKHAPPKGPFTIAQPMTFDANATGTDLKNVTLSYRILEQSPTGGFIVGDLIQVPMLLKAAGKDTYSYTIPGSEISGVYVNYYISAFDGSNNVYRTDVYNLSIGDFDWELDRTDEVILIRTIRSEVSLKLTPINGFNKPVSIRVVGSPPAGVSIRPASSQVTPPNPAVLQITTTSDAEIARKAEVRVEAVYTPPGASAVQIIRPITLVVTVTDFNFEVSPNYLEAQRDKDATYSFKLTVHDGFTVPNGFKISVTGLPDKTSYRLQLVEYKIDQDEVGIATYNLVVSVESGAKTGLYLFDIKITAVTSGGGTISHSVNNIQLKIT